MRSARADLSLASAEYSTQLLTALRDVDNQLSAVRILGDRAETLRSIADDDEILATMLQARYANGLISQLEYVDGLRVILEHRRTAVQVNIARYVATIGLIRALGGGWGAPGSGSARGGRLAQALGVPFFLELDGDVAIGGKPHLVALDRRDQAERDIMMVALVRALAAVGLGQLDPVAFDPVDGADMDSVGADHFHIFSDRVALRS